MCDSPMGSHRIMGKRMNRSQGRTPASRIGITTTVAKCDSCGLVYSNPQPVPFDLQDHYSVLPEVYWKDHYFRTDPGYFSEEIRKLKSLIDFKPGMRSLDIGAGLGKAMISLSKAGFDTYGFEPSEPFHERAISKMGIDPGKLKLGMIEQMEYPADYFDFISFGAVLEHLYNPSLSIIKAMQWLKPGGIMHIEVPSSDWLINRIVNLYYRLTGTDYVANISPMHEPFHLYEFGLGSFRAHSQKHNYKIAHHEYYVCETYLPKVADFILRPIMERTGTGMQLCLWLRK